MLYIIADLPFFFLLKLMQIFRFFTLKNTHEQTTNKPRKNQSFFKEPSYWKNDICWYIVDHTLYRIFLIVSRIFVITVIYSACFVFLTSLVVV